MAGEENQGQEGGQDQSQGGISDLNYEFVLNEGDEHEQGIGENIGEITEDGLKPKTPGEIAEEGEDQSNDENDQSGGQPPVANPEIAALTKQIESLHAKLDQQGKEKEQSDKVAKRNEEKATLQGQYQKLTKDIETVMTNPKKYKSGTLAKLQGQLAQVTAKAELITQAEEKEKAEAEEAEKNQTNDPNAELPQEAKNWIARNAWFNQPQYFQWKNHILDYSNQLVENGYDPNDPNFYVAIDNALKDAGFKKPKSEVPPLKLGGNPLGSQKRPAVKTGSPTKPIVTKMGETGKKVVKLDSQRKEMMQGLGIGDNPEYQQAYARQVVKNSSKTK